jgi:hypothetical protein
MKRPNCPFPGCTGGCSACGAATQSKRDAVAYKTAYTEHHDAVVAEAFPEPRHDQESDVGHLVKRMLIRRLVFDAFNAGWMAAGKPLPGLNAAKRKGRLR